MPDKKTIEDAQRDKRQGKAPGTQAGEFVREEMEHIREGKHGARSAKQAIAIGLSKARRAGVKLAAPKKGSPELKRKARRDLESGRHPHAVSSKRSRATMGALKREGSSAASSTSLSRQAHSAAAKRTPSSRKRAARKAVATKRHEGILSSAASKAAHTRASHARH
jgi:hypothetical protein